MIALLIQGQLFVYRHEKLSHQLNQSINQSSEPRRPDLKPLLGKTVAMFLVMWAAVQIPDMNGQW
jgi:hypothetical protein